MKEDALQKIFEKQLVDIVLTRAEGYRPLKLKGESNGVRESVAWKWAVKNWTSLGVMVDVARWETAGSRLFLFELKAAVGPVFKECGYLQITAELYESRSGRKVLPYMVAPAQSLFLDENRRFSVMATLNNQLEGEPSGTDVETATADVVSAFVTRTGMGCIFIETDDENDPKKIVRVHVFEPKGWEGGLQAELGRSSHDFDIFAY